MAPPASTRPSARAAVLGAALPLIFLHAEYNPGFEIAAGSTTIGVDLSDLALLAVGLATLATLATEGLPRLEGTRVVWWSTAALLTLVAASTLWGPLVTETYPFAANAVSASSFAQYAVLVPAVVVLVRTRGDTLVVVGALVAWTAVAALVAALQIVGLVGNLDQVPAGRRMPSFLGYHELSALSGAVLGLACAAIALGRTGTARRWLVVAAAAGTTGLVIGGALASLAGVIVGAAVTLLIASRREVLTARRGLVVGCVVLVACAGTFALRSGPIADFVGFLGDDEDESQAIETYSQRTVLSYIGLRIFLDHPVLGVGWQGSLLEESYAPHLAAARRRFPDVAEGALPSSEHPWGVQNAFIQAGADMGVAGLALLVAVLASAAWSALRASSRPAGPDRRVLALATVTALAVCAFELAALGLIGNPIDGLLWLAVGAAVALRRVERPDA